VNAGGRLGLFALAAGAVFAGAAGVGRAIDLDAGESRPHEGHGSEAGAPTHGHEPETDHAAPAASASPGAISEAGLRLVTESRELTAGRETPFSFRIVDTRGATVRDFDLAHGKRMHFLVARRDLSGYQHLHPTQATDGSWSVPLRLVEAGVYRVFADFESGGRRATLGTDVAVPGTFEPHELPKPAATAQTGEYEVRLDDEAGSGGRVTFAVLRDGAPVSDLEPYLGALGHLVTLREGDLAFLHVHPEDDATSAGTITFRVDYPSQGRYRLFLQFQHEGRVHTVAFTREV
jgi:hypothetical protein